MSETVRDVIVKTVLETFAIKLNNSRFSTHFTIYCYSSRTTGPIEAPSSVVIIWYETSLSDSASEHPPNLVLDINCPEIFKKLF